MEKQVGEVSMFFSKVGVAAVKLSDTLSIGDKIHIKGHTTDFEQKVSSMQLENKNLQKAKKGEHVGVKVIDKVRPNDKVYIVK
jgi:putative protease